MDYIVCLYIYKLALETYHQENISVKDRFIPIYWASEQNKSRGERKAKLLVT